MGQDLFALARERDVHKVLVLAQPFELRGHVLPEVIPLQMKELVVVRRHVHAQRYVREPSHSSRNSDCFPEHEIL